MRGLAATIGMILVCAGGCGPEEEWPREEHQRSSNMQVQHIPKGDPPESATPSNGRRVTFLGKEFVQRESISFDSYLSQDFYLPDDTKKQWSEKIGITVTARQNSHRASPQVTASTVRAGDPEAYTRLDTDDDRQRTVLVFAYLRSKETLECGVVVSRFSDDGSESISEQYRRRQAAPESGVIDEDIKLALDDLKERILNEQFPVGEWPPDRPGLATYDGPMPVYVTPYYNSKGPVIRTGMFDRELLAVDSQSMDALLEDMEAEWDSLPIETMFVTSIRLYDFDRDEDAVYWFFAAMIRAMLFRSQTIGGNTPNLGDPSFQLKSAHNAFGTLIRDFLVQRFSSNRDAWVKCVRRAVTRSRDAPDLAAIYPRIKFAERPQWQDGLDRILEDIETKLQESPGRDESGTVRGTKRNAPSEG